MHRYMAVLGCVLALVAARESGAATWYAGEFLGVGIGPRAISMGGAAVATAQGADAPYWNPAALAGERSRALSFEHAERFGGIVAHDALAATLPLARGGLGLILFRGAVDNIAAADSTILPDPTRPPDPTNMPDPSKVRTFSNSDYVLHLAWGRPLAGGLAVGGAVKLIRRAIDRTGAFGYGLDLGARWTMRDRVSVGLMLRDISTTRVAWDEGRTDVVYPSVHLGTAYTAPMPGNGRLTVSAASVLGPEKGGYGGFAPWRIGVAENPGALGAEYAWHEAIMLRVGSRDVRGLMGPGTGQISAGVGLRARIPWARSISRVGLDVAWTRHTLRDSFRIGANVDL